MTDYVRFVGKFPCSTVHNGLVVHFGEDATYFVPRGRAGQFCRPVVEGEPTPEELLEEAAGLLEAVFATSPGKFLRASWLARYRKLMGETK